MWVEFRHSERSWLGYSSFMELRTKHSPFVSYPKRVTGNKTNREIWVAVEIGDLTGQRKQDFQSKSSFISSSSRRIMVLLFGSLCDVLFKKQGCYYSFHHIPKRLGTRKINKTDENIHS